MHSLDWNDLRYFLAVHRVGTLAGAARDLGVRHSTVGRRIEALEAALDASLFGRAPDGFVLTEAGGEILPFAEAMERAAMAVERRVAGQDNRVEGLVRVTTSEGFSGFLVRHLSELQARHPALTVEVLTTNTLLDLARGDADIAVRFVETKTPDLVSKHICEAGWSLYASKTYLSRTETPKNVENLAGHNVVGFDETMSHTPGAAWLGEHMRGTRVVMRCNSLIAALNATTASMGIAMLPCFLAEAEPGLRRLTDEILASRDVWLVFHPDLKRVKRVRVVIDFVAEIVRRDRAMFSGKHGENAG